MSAATYTQNALLASAATPHALHFQNGSVVALVDNAGRLPLLMQALAGLGVERAAIDVIHRATLQNAPPRLLDQLISLLCCIGPERELAGRYRAELERGAVIVTIDGIQAGQRDDLVAALKSAGGHCIHEFGRFTIRTLAA